MADTFFEFDTFTQPSEDLLKLGEGGVSDSYDAVNDETFGAEACEDDWEGDHEQLVELTRRQRTQSSSACLYNGDYEDLGNNTALERNISNLVLDEDELDDPAIINASRARPIPNTAGSVLYPRKSPPPAFLQSDGVGSPSTKNIWSPGKPGCLDDDSALSLSKSLPDRLPPGFKKLPHPSEPVTLLSQVTPFFDPTLPPPPIAHHALVSVHDGSGHIRTLEEIERDLKHTNITSTPNTSLVPPQLARQRPHWFRYEHHRRRPSGPWSEPLGQGRWEPRRNGYQDVDEYAGLMTTRDRQWLINIQMMQVQSNCDNYLKSYLAKKHQTKQQKRGGDHRMLDKASSLEARDYRPPQMENSLGRLQVVSVNAPRKIIDVHVVKSEEGSPSHQRLHGPRDARRQRQLLLEIEKIYLLLLELEDLDGSDTEARTVLANRLWSEMNVDDKLGHIMLVRKGKLLVLRSLPYLSPAQHTSVLTVLLQTFSQIFKRDQADQLASQFYEMARDVIADSTVSEVVRLGRALVPDTDACHAARHPAAGERSNLQTCVYSGVGVSMLLLLAVRGDSLLAHLPPSDPVVASWAAIMTTVAETIQLSSFVAQPLDPLPDGVDCLLRYVGSSVSVGSVRDKMEVVAGKGEMF